MQYTLSPRGVQISMYTSVITQEFWCWYAGKTNKRSCVTVARVAAELRGHDYKTGYMTGLEKSSPLDHNNETPDLTCLALLPTIWRR